MVGEDVVRAHIVDQEQRWAALERRIYPALGVLWRDNVALGRELTRLQDDLEGNDHA